MELKVFIGEETVTFDSIAETIKSLRVGSLKGQENLAFAVYGNEHFFIDSATSEEIVTHIENHKDDIDALEWLEGHNIGDTDVCTDDEDRMFVYDEHGKYRIDTMAGFEDRFWDSILDILG